jgi:hypothetical protein
LARQIIHKNGYNINVRQINKNHIKDGLSSLLFLTGYPYNRIPFPGAIPAIWMSDKTLHYSKPFR